jgi:quercetin dioxygenase-like cupin family protein
MSMSDLDAMTAASDHHAIILENEQVRMLDTKVRPGEQTHVHTHQWPAALYVVSWSDFVRYDPEGNVLLDSRTLASRPEPGSALWTAPAVPHYVRNVGTTDLHIIAVEVKPPHPENL